MFTLPLPNDESTIYAIDNEKLYFAYFGHDPPSAFLSLNIRTGDVKLIFEDVVDRWTCWMGIKSSDGSIWFTGEYHDATTSSWPLVLFRYDPPTNKLDFVKKFDATEALGIAEYGDFIFLGRIFPEWGFGFSRFHMVPKATWKNTETWIEGKIPQEGRGIFAVWKNQLLLILHGIYNFVAFYQFNSVVGAFEKVAEFPKSRYAEAAVAFDDRQLYLTVADDSLRAHLLTTTNLEAWQDTPLDITFKPIDPAGPPQTEQALVILPLGDSKFLLFKTFYTIIRGGTDGITDLYQYDLGRLQFIGQILGGITTIPLVSSGNVYLTTSNPNYVYSFEIGVQPRVCAIATASYGSPLAPQLFKLRRFRDRCLPKPLTNLYYALSPPIAWEIQRHQRLKFLTRKILDATLFLLRRVHK